MNERWTELRDKRELVDAIHDELSYLQRVHAPDAMRAAAHAWCLDRERYWAREHGAPSWMTTWVPWLRPSQAAGQELRDDDQRGELAPSENIFRQAVDTVLNQLLADVPALRIGVEGTGLEAQFIARDRGGALNAIINTPAAQQIIRRTAIDVVLSGLGVLKPQVCAGRVELCQRYRWQVLWHPEDARDRDPEEMHEWYATSQRSIVAQLRASGCDQATISRVAALDPIDDRVPPWTSYGEIPRDPDEYYYEQGHQYARTCPTLYVSESYQVATEEGQGDGRHVVIVWGANGGEVVYDETFDRIATPLVLWHYTPPRKGAQSVGLGDLMLRWQEKVDRGAASVVEALEVLGQSHALVSDNLVKDIATPGLKLVPVAPGAFGQGPQFVLIKHEPVSAQLMEWVDDMPGRAMRNAGISDMLSAGQSQLGANAPAIALQAEERRVRNRLANVLAERNAALRATGTQVLYAVDAMVESQPRALAHWEQHGDRKSARWKDLLPPRSDRVVQVEPYGATSNSFAAQLAVVQDFSDRGLVGAVSQRLGMLDDPDMRRIAQYELAPIKYVLHQVESLIRTDGGDDEKAERWGRAMPDANTPYDVAQEIALRTLHLAQASESDDDTIVRLAIYLEQLEQFGPPAMPAAGPAPGAPAGAPPQMAAGVM